MVGYIDAQLPRRERVEHGLRTELRAYPEDTIREPLGAALIHQDFSVMGAGPMVEIFIDRVEITNPGTRLFLRTGFSTPHRSRETKRSRP